MPSKVAIIFLSPAMPSAVLLYGIIFGFALWSYLGWPWLRSDTITLYLATSVWAVAAIVRRQRITGFSLSRLDVVFCAFLLVVLGSIATHWWDGTARYVEILPCFFVLPFALGRMMNVRDVMLFQNILLGMGGILLLLLPIEYRRNLSFASGDSVHPYLILFGQPHGAMLSNIVFSSTLVALVSLLVLLSASHGADGRKEKWRRFFGYMMVALVIASMAWISNRGAVLIAVLGVMGVLLVSSYCEWRRRVAVLLYVSLFVVVAFLWGSQDDFKRKHYWDLLQSPTDMRDVSGEELSAQARSQGDGQSILADSSCAHLRAMSLTDSVATRWTLYRAGWDMFRANPWSGVGANSYGFYLCGNRGWHPHSTILQVLSELGVLGGLVYFTMVGMAFGVLGRRCLLPAAVCVKAGMGWVLAFTVMQFAMAQLYGNYFVSASLYFVVGLAASFQSDAEGKRRLA